MVRQMVNSLGFRKVFRPWLESLIKHSWIDPREAKDGADFERRYNVAWAQAQSADQILKFVDDKVKEAEYLEQKEEGKIEDPFSINEE